ncbi:sigma-54-dependent Fis family transcriptional regulator [Echinicola sp. CAU 1574]|uniref:Sigma-54-dependent Fis family transcriptional regulator n=1 Tax=Echinicola arenosa TaxID=2774144 RepID=A0ABR9AIX1_9BACT|nr:sigma-54 dependent transcriptional regulator [Echinicola arenosa]MBD8488267.1 sigma-54-dependent Fis family transcriptional regulator [Echinicola arenosa]
MEGKILIVDDNKSILNALEFLLEEEYSCITSISNPNKITGIGDLDSYDAVLLDMNFSAEINTGNEGLYWLRQIKAKAPELPVIMITAYGDMDLAIKSLKEGAVDFVLKPWDNQKLLATLRSAYQLGQSRKEVGNLKKNQANLKSLISQKQQPIIGESNAIKEMLAIIRKVAQTTANVLITGENGTGKELIAQEIHRNSPRANEVFVGVDMGSIQESLFESELFGHVKGSFTDAKEDRTGKFEAAHGGSLFLDEIGNLSYPLQSKLLSTLQNREVVKVGSNKPVPIDIRLICATNSNLDEMVSNGDFREDLLYRINTIHIEVPPLRERGEDILLLANFFTKKYGSKYGKGALSIHKNAQKKLMDYSWPGNIRELQHTIERSVILCEGSILQGEDILLKQRSHPALNELEMTLEDMERDMIANALSRHHGNYTAAAEQLGVSRQTLYNKTKRYGL